MTQSGWPLLACLGGHSAIRSHRRRERCPILLFGDSGANAEWPIDTFVICLWSHGFADNLTWEPTSVRTYLGLPSAHASRRGPRCSLDWTIYLALPSGACRCGQQYSLDWRIVGTSDCTGDGIRVRFPGSRPLRASDDLAGGTRPTLSLVFEVVVWQFALWAAALERLLLNFNGHQPQNW